MQELLNNSEVEQDDNHWMSVSDLMAGLMIVFLFIAIALMRSAFIERDRIKEVAVAYQEDQVAIYDSLLEEFKPDLERWNAEIDQETLTFVFNSPDVLFRNNEKRLSSRYKALLGDFFPRYMTVLNQFQRSVTEVLIEGHTSSVWNRSVNATDAYFLNMQLSQDRTRSVLEYVYQLPTVDDYRPWIKSHVAAVGFSSSRPILDSIGEEDKGRSRRVTFRVVTNAEIRIKQILDGVQ